MRVYHTGKLEIPRPDIHHGRKNADFGQGFYVTPDRAFALRWASSQAVVNEYELDTDGLSVKTFRRDRAWSDYLSGNRRLLPDAFAHTDIVQGPIANDTLYDTFGIITSGLLSPDEAFTLLNIGPEYVQLALKTGQAAAHLTFLSSWRVPESDLEHYARLVREEEEAYQALFANAMEQLLDRKM